MTAELHDRQQRVATRLPDFSWSSPTQWTTRPAPVSLLVLGLVLFGIGDWMFIASQLGNTPWTVLADGVSNHVGLGIGYVTIATSIVVLLCWIPLRQRPGMGTIGNAVIIGATVELLEHLVEPPSGLALRIALMAGGLVTAAAGGALYLSTHLGPGPRDGLMTGIGRRFDIPIARTRLAIEISVMAAGALLGGRIGVGTALFAVGIGHTLAFLIAWLHRLDTPAHRAS